MIPKMTDTAFDKLMVRAKEMSNELHALGCVCVILVAAEGTDGRPMVAQASNMSAKHVLNALQTEALRLQAHLEKRNNVQGHA